MFDSFKKSLSVRPQHIYLGTVGTNYSLVYIIKRPRKIVGSVTKRVLSVNRSPKVSRRAPLWGALPTAHTEMSKLS